VVYQLLRAVRGVRFKGVEKVWFLRKSKWALTGGAGVSLVANCYI
jgi:hypothetical protein